MARWVRTTALARGSSMNALPPSRQGTATLGAVDMSPWLQLTPEQKGRSNVFLIHRRWTGSEGAGWQEDRKGHPHVRHERNRVRRDGRVLRERLPAHSCGRPRVPTWVPDMGLLTYLGARRPSRVSTSLTGPLRWRLEPCDLLSCDKVSVRVNELRSGFATTTRSPEGLQSHSNRKSGRHYH